VSASPIDLESPAASTAPRTTRAVVRERYGRPDVLRVRTVEIAPLEPGDVLVHVKASSVNPADWYAVTGLFFARLGNGLRRPDDSRVGGDVAGHVVAVGPDVDDLRPGDEVFGLAAGAWAEYAPAPAARLAPKPAGVTFEEAAAAPVAAVTALQALRDHARVQPGQTVLINGASGGVGTFAVQLAKAFGAGVTAVCSTPNIELAHSLGADRVIDYTREDFTRAGLRHDVMLDIAGSRSFGQFKRAMKPEGTVVLIGGRLTYRGFGPLPHLGATIAVSRRRRPRVTFFVAKIYRDDLLVLRDLLDAGTVKPAIDRRFRLEETAEAVRYLGQGHARSKVVITT
jgi:NADPH:quinone reductase-like Zn-dependent oxidoreductase